MSIIIDDAVVSESASFVRFTIRLTSPSAQTVSVNYNTANLGASNGSDYTGQTGTLNFAPGQTTLTIDIPILNNATAELIESFALVLSAPVNDTIGRGVGIATIIDNDGTAGTPVIQLHDTIVDERAGTVSFVVNLDRPSNSTVTVQYATTSGTATAGSDFTALALQTLTFLPGEVSKTVTVALINDSGAEGGEFFDLTLSAPTGATLPDAVARAFIGASDQPTQTTPVISIANAQAHEGDGYMDFVVTLSGPSTQPISVNYTTGNSTASNGLDYNGQASTLIFAPGETLKTIRIPIIDNATAEGTENLFLTLSGASGATVGNNVAIGTIYDNDATAGTPVIQIGNAIVDEKDGRVYLTVTLDRPSTGAVSVNYATGSGTATSGSDFQGMTTQTLSFAAGEVSKTIVVNLLDDTSAEGGEYFNLLFSGVVGASLPDNLARVYIGASDQPTQVLPVISLSNAQAGEGDGFIDFVVTLSGPSAQPVSVNYTTSNSTASATLDYSAQAGTLVFEAGETTKIVRIGLIENTSLELAENFFLSLSGASGASIGNNVALGTLVDDDSTAGTPLIRVGDVFVDEKDGRAYITVSLDRPSTGAVSVKYATADGSALAGSDYQGESLQTLSFAAGEVSKTIAINLVDDAGPESGEHFDVLFSAPSGATLADTTARVFIGPSDQPAQVLPVVSLSSGQAGENQAYMDFVVTLSGPSTQPVSVNYTTSNGSAGATVDYSAQAGTLVFEVGETTKVVRIGLIDNATLESTENLFLSLSGASGALIGNNVAVGTIIDNDSTAGTPLIRIGDTLVDEKDGLAYVTVTLDRPSTGPVSVQYATANGSALAGSDYGAQSLQTLSFAAGEVSKTIAVNLLDDAGAESGEYFNVNFSGAVGATLADTVAKVFIGASDQPAQLLPVLSLSNAIGGEGQGYVDFVVTLSGPSAQAVTVNYTTSNSTASSGIDYSGYAGSLVFEAGETTKVVRVGLINDAVLEPTDNFFMSLSGATGASIGNNVAIGTIIDNDSAAGTPLLTVGDVLVDEKDGRAYVTVTLDRPSTGTVSVNVATSNGSALAGSDYEAQPTQPLVFAAGEVSKTLVVNLIDDVAAEPGEYFNLTFSGVSGATMPDTTARVFIGASDGAVQALPELSVANAQAGEGQGYIDFVVSLGAPSTQAVSVNYTTGNGSAANGTDYSGQSGSLVFEAGETTKVVRIGLINNDTTAEFTENLFLSLSGASGATLGNNVAIGTLIDNDAVAGTPVMHVSDAVVDEKDGRAYITVSLDRPSTGPVSVAYATAGATAAAGSDFETQPSQTLLFAPGQTSKTIAVNLIDDTTVESSHEVFDVVFSSASGATLADNRAHVVIGPSDTATLLSPTLSVSAPVVSEGDGYVDFIVAMNAPSAQAVTVNYSTANGTAASGSDYNGYAGSLVFAAGETVKVVRVGLVDNATAEANETFTLVLSGALGATIGTTPVVATILDNDPAAAGGVTIVGTNGPDVLHGMAGADTLSGGEGNDVLDGGAGNDGLSGGLGNDTYLVEQAGDTVNEAAGGGTDTVISYLSTYTLGANVERLVLGSGAVTGIGNTLANTIIGSAGNNTLDGGAGADAFDGGAGVDTVTYATSAGGVNVNLGANLATGGNAQGDTFANVENLTGSNLNDSLLGNASANVLNGGGGNDTLNGAAAADTLTGGAGLDTFVFASLTGVDAVTDFSSVDDTLRFSMASIHVGDGDTVVEGAAVRAAPGGFSTAAEVVIFTTNIVGPITAAAAAAQIGSATAAYAVGADVLFAVDNGTQTGVFLFQSAGADALVSDTELTQVALLTGAATVTADYTFVA